MAQAAPNQDDINALVEQMQAGADALAGDAKAVQAAAATAQDILAEMGDSDAAGEVPREPVGKEFSPELRRLLAIEVPVIVQLGVRRMNVGEVMRFSVGSIIEFQKASDEELDLLANNQNIGKGFAVKVGENFGIKLTAIGSVKEVIRKLGGE